MVSNLVSTSEKDYLEVDQPIRGQKYVSLSFLCPEDVLDDKNVFFFGEFMRSFSQDMDVLFKNLVEKYPEDKPLIDTIRGNHLEFFDANELQEKYRFFCKANINSLEDTFHEMNDFKTTIRGIKVRGVYANKKEGEAHILKLKATDTKHNIWLGDVGAWLPFADNPQAIENQTYPEAALNTLMREYNKNREDKAREFDSRKDQMLNGNKEFKVEVVETEGEDATKSLMEGEDVWLSRKKSEQ